MSKQINCVHCDNTGLSKKARELQSLWFCNPAFKPSDRQSTPFPEDEPIILAIAEHALLVKTRYKNRQVEPSKEDVAAEARRLCAIYNSSWQHHLNQDDVAALCAERRLLDFTHIFDQGEWVEKFPAVVPTPAQVNAWSLHGIGHDVINRMICIKAECERLGETLNCPHCK